MRRGRRWSSSESNVVSHLPPELLLDQPPPASISTVLFAETTSRVEAWTRDNGAAGRFTGARGCRRRWKREHAGAAPPRLPAEDQRCVAGAAPPVEPRARGSRTGTASRRRFILGRYQRRYVT